jgi:hypothetical protein
MLVPRKLLDSHGNICQIIINGSCIKLIHLDTQHKRIPTVRPASMCRSRRLPNQLHCCRDGELFPPPSDLTLLPRVKTVLSNPPLPLNGASSSHTVFNPDNESGARSPHVRATNRKHPDCAIREHSCATSFVRISSAEPAHIKTPAFAPYTVHIKVLT